MPIGLNTQVFLRKLERGEPFILEVLEDGVLLCGDESFYRRVIEVYRRVREGYVRVGKTWAKVG